MMTGTVTIDGREIGPGLEPYVICELSANHNGSLERALEMIDAAAATGADAIKVQTYTPDTLTIDHDGPGFRIEGGLWHGRTLYDLYSEAYTPFEWHEAMFARARQLGVTMFSTPFDESAADLLESLDAPAYKIASFEMTDLPLVAYVAAKMKPMIISTGMATPEEIAAAVDTARAHGTGEIVLLHCISSYPAPIEQANVATVPHLAAKFGCVGGLSDHTLTDTAAMASMALGGAVVEKHFTLDRSEGGPDSTFSLEPAEFARLVKNCKDTWRAVGQVTEGATQAEEANKAFRRSLYAVADIAAGEAFTKANMRSIRPGFGLPPGRYDDVLGAVATSAIKRGQPITADMVDGLS
ncbi:MAG: pseudaminic acid synthase [Pikeienuella sp.]